MSLESCNSKGMNSSSLVSSISFKVKTQSKSVSLFLVLNIIFIFFCLVLFYVLKIEETCQLWNVKY